MMERFTLIEIYIDYMTYVFTQESIVLKKEQKCDIDVVENLEDLGEENRIKRSRTEEREKRESGDARYSFIIKA